MGYIDRSNHRSLIMSFNRILPHAKLGYVEAILDGLQDWLSLVEITERIVDALDEHQLNRLLLDYSKADMRVAVAEAPDVVKFFHTFANRTVQFGVILPLQQRSLGPVEALIESAVKLGHPVEVIESEFARQVWIDPGQRLASRTA
jgi:hypothetical protein